MFSAVARTIATPANTLHSAAAAAAERDSGDNEESVGRDESVASVAAEGAVEVATKEAVVRAAGLASGLSGLSGLETLERLAFFLENSLEERLLAWVSAGEY